MAGLLATTAAVLPAPTIPHHPDAELLGRCRAYLEHSARTDALYASIMEACDALGIDGTMERGDHPAVTSLWDAYDGATDELDILKGAVTGTAVRTAVGAAGKLLVILAEGSSVDACQLGFMVLRDLLDIAAPGAQALLVAIEPENPAPAELALALLSEIEAAAVTGRA